MIGHTALPMQVALALAILACPSAVAYAADDDEWCRNGGFAVENAEFGEGFVTASGKTYFANDMHGCPLAGTNCQTKTYVLIHDKLVLGRSQGRFICAYFPNRAGGTAGWIEAARLQPVAANTHPPLRAWLGEWSDRGNARQRFSLQHGQLVVDGDAFWPSRNPDPQTLRDHPGWPHSGDIGGLVSVDGNHAHNPQCNVSFTLLPDFMVAADPDMQCGGMNVSFSGIYQRVKR